MLSKKITKEIIKMLMSIFIMLIIMVLFFAIFGYFNLPVIFGALLGGIVAFLNFFFLAVSVENAVKEDKNPKIVVASSYSLRMLFIGVMIVVAIKSPYFNYVAMVIPLIFPRIAIMITNLIKKRVK